MGAYIFNSYTFVLCVLTSPNTIETNKVLKRTPFNKTRQYNIQTFDKTISLKFRTREIKLQKQIRTPLNLTETYLDRNSLVVLIHSQVRSGQCLTCTFRASCCSARLSRAQVPQVPLSGTEKKREYQQSDRNR